jgi:hypothetical protein
MVSNLNLLFPRLMTVRAIALVLCALLSANVSLRAGEPVPKTNADGQAVPGETAAEEPAFNNWITLTIGGIITSGDEAQFKQQHRIGGPVYGGIGDLHYEQTVGKNGQFSIDGHALVAEGDYDVTVSLSQPDLGYIKAGYTQFRSWYDGNGGYFPVNGAFFPPPFPEMHIDRGDAWVELGLQLPDWPEIIVRYSHEFRNGMKDATYWGDTSLTGITNGSSSRKIVPAFRNIDETRDIVTLELSKTFGNTDIGLGMRYEHDKNNDDYNIERGAGAPNQRFITQKENNSLDLFSGHATTETHFSDALWLTTAYSYTGLSSDLTGTRIYGPTYNSSYSDPIATLSPFDHGYLNLAGTSELHQWVISFNLMWLPAKDLTVVTALRYTNENKQSSSFFLETSTRTAPLIPMAASSFENFNTFAETFELRYGGIANWLFYARGDWEEQNGDIHETYGETDLPAISGIKNLDLFRQKYTVGFNWYPAQRLNLAAQYYYKNFRYDNSSNADGQRLDYQEWKTNNVNFRLTLRPSIPPAFGTLALVTRWDWTSSSVVGQWFIPDDILLASEHTALIRNQVITESITWSPLARLYFQGDIAYVLNQTKTPAANIIIVPGAGPTVLNFQSDYWTLGGSLGYLLDDKTEFRVGYMYYRAADYRNNSLAGLPYGADQTENTVTASMTRQLTKNIRLNLSYGYFNYKDGLYGGHNDYQAHSIFSSLAFGF